MIQSCCFYCKFRDCPQLAPVGVCHACGRATIGGKPHFDRCLKEGICELTPSGCRTERACWVEAPATVVNCKQDTYDALIDRTTIFGNPFSVKVYGREGCIKKHRKYFFERIERDPAFKEKVLGLRGLRLGCHCKQPKKEVGCHGDTFCQYLNAYSWLVKIKKEAGINA